jgi:hypothetical protein
VPPATNVPASALSSKRMRWSVSRAAVGRAGRVASLVSNATSGRRSAGRRPTHFERLVAGWLPPQAFLGSNGH